MKTLKALPTRCALTKGADLWVISDPQYSTWNKLIDWHLHFQLKKSRFSSLQSPNTSHIAQYIPPHHNTPLEKFKWNPPTPLPLLLKSANWLPNRWTLELGYSPRWIDILYQIWLLLEKPGLRIFTPQFLTVKQLTKQWNNVTNMDSLQYVEELMINGLKH